MLKEANRECLRLWQDESGVVLALTVICFLILFVMGSAVFAIGETVRQRVVLQNAADAAAYSAAIVEADTLSRVAAINRGMAWTYVQMCRMEMDYIVDKWLEKVVQEWEITDSIAQTFNDPSTCNRGRPMFFWAGYNQAYDKYVMLNQTHLVSIDEIRQTRQQAAAAGKSYNQLAQPIDDARETIETMIEEEEDLLKELPGRIEKTVEEILKFNISDTGNDDVAGGADIMWCLFQEEDWLGRNTRIMRMDEEDDFLMYADYYDGARQTLDRGADVWYNQAMGAGEGIQREYVQGSSLRADWSYYSTLWEITDAGCTLIGTLPQTPRWVLGEDVRVERYFVSVLAQPRILQDVYFAEGGSIVVGLTRRMNNPLFFVYGDEGEAGVFKAFTMNENGRFMWTASAAMAGYMSTREPGVGHYEVTAENNDHQKKWNLKTSDWDAAFLPLHRADAMGIDRSWNGETAGQILADVRGGPWKALYGGGGAVGEQGGPKGMNEGANFNESGAEAWVLH